MQNRLNNHLLDVYLSLTDQQVSILILRYCFGLKIREIAEIKNLNRGSVFYALKRYKKLNELSELSAIIQLIFSPEFCDIQQPRAIINTRMKIGTKKSLGKQSRLS